MGPRDHQRAADVDRDAVAERLREAVTEGRLDLDEFDDRLGRTYAAKTYGELDKLVGDLPRQRAAPVAETGRDRRAMRGWLAETWRPWSTVVTICAAVWLLTVMLSQQPIYPWPLWVAVPWGAVLLCRTIYGISVGEPQQWASRPAPRRSC